MVYVHTGSAYMVHISMFLYALRELRAMNGQRRRRRRRVSAPQLNCTRKRGDSFTNKLRCVQCLHFCMCL